MPGLFGSPTHLFEPVPRFPSAASETTGLQVTGSEHATRKRSRYDNLDFEGDACSTAVQSLNTDFWAQSFGSSRSSYVKSPPPLANDRYELAGGMEVMDRSTRHKGDIDDYFNLGKQRGMWSAPTSPPTHIPPLRHQHTELQLTPDGPKPWMFNQLMSIVGGVAGKLYQFCSVPFRGFQAGGGRAYTFENREVAAKLGLQQPVPDEPSSSTQHPLPGRLPENDYGVLSMESLESERPRAKRLRTGENWVVVDKDGETESRPSTPRMAARRVPSHTRSPSQIPRPVSRASVATPARKRPSLIPISRRSTMDRRSFRGSFTAESQPHGAARSYSRDSYGSPAMFENKTPKKKSPLPPESQRLINKMRREEVEDDARMRRMSCQMSAMLREAQEALGSKFEIQDEYMDDDDDEEEDDDDVGAIDDIHAKTMRRFPR